MRLTTLFGYVTAMAAAAYVVAVCTDSDDDIVEVLKETLADGKREVIDADFTESSS